MTLNELKSKYNFHDSSIESILYDKSKSELSIAIDFCYWLQENFDEESSEKENGLVSLAFSGVTDYNWRIGEIDSYDILEIEIEGDEVYMRVLDAFNSNYYDLTFNAKSVEFVEK